MTTTQWKRNPFPDVRVDIGSAYELLLHLAVVSGDANSAHIYEIGQPRLEQMRAQAATYPNLSRQIGMFGGEDCKAWMNLMGLVYDCAPPRDVPTFLAHLEATDAMELRLHLLG